MCSSNRNARVGVVVHDAGGAEILASYVQQEALDCLFVLDGPAEKIFKDRLGSVQVVSLETAIKKCDWLLTGTGWQTDFEWQAIYQGKNANKHTVTFLDHWVNYKSRFIRNGIECFSDEIWVGDQHAFSIAKNNFPDVCVQLVENPYFKYFLSEIEKISELQIKSQKNKSNILFVCENINRKKFHQNHAIRFFMSNLDSLESDIAQILIRPHPSEEADKYSWVQEEFGSNLIEASVKLSNGKSLVNEIAESDIVVGCTSMAMVLGLLAGRRVISCIPKNEIPFTLPFEGIELLSDITTRSNNEIE